MRHLLTIAIALLSLTGCATNKRAVDSANPVTVREYERICRGAIAAVAGKSIDIVGADPRHEDGPVGPIVALSYIRESDRTEWRYRCFLDGDRVIWAANGGRWRNDPRDEIISFALNRPEGSFVIRQRFSDGSISEKTFSL